MFLDIAISKDYKKLLTGKLNCMVNDPYFKKQIMLELNPKGPRFSPKLKYSFLMIFCPR